MFQTEETVSPFTLKMKGDFEEALIEYASRYFESIRSENELIADICFDQIFDICLLEHLKEGRKFESKGKLLEDIERSLVNVLTREEAGHEEFKKRFGSCNRRLFPRGRSTGAFSVDAKWLLKTGQ